jgi:hypothetical protein
MKRWKLLGGIVMALVFIYGVSAGALYVAMRQPPERFGAIMTRVPDVAMMVLPFEPLWMRARQGDLSVGDPAPDFVLPRLTGNSAVRLSAEWRYRPVVLVFGSYT